MKVIVAPAGHWEKSVKASAASAAERVTWSWVEGSLRNWGSLRSRVKWRCALWARSVRLRWVQHGWRLVNRLVRHGRAGFACFLLLFFRMVLLEADVPRQAAHSRHRLKLVDDVAWDEVDVVIAQLQACVPDSLTPQLVQLRIVYPLHTLQGTGALWVFQYRNMNHELSYCSSLWCYNLLNTSKGLIHGHYT